MRMILIALRWLLGGLLAMTAGAALAQPVERVRCESFDYRYQSCPVRDPQYVDLVERLGGRCQPGADWGVNLRGIFVQNGCRAVFAVRRPSPGPFPPGPPPGPGFGGQRIVCESWNFRPASCPADTRGGVRLSRLIAGDCREGATWDWDRRGVNVRGGCRAEFVAGRGGGGGGNWGGGQTIDCNSWNYQPARCPADIRRGVDLVQVYGGECIEGRTWQWDRRGISVRNGCRARFLLR